MNGPPSLGCHLWEVERSCKGRGSFPARFCNPARPPSSGGGYSHRTDHLLGSRPHGCAPGPGGPARAWVAGQWLLPTPLAAVETAVQSVHGCDWTQPFWRGKPRREVRTPTNHQGRREGQKGGKEAKAHAPFCLSHEAHSDAMSDRCGADKHCTGKERVC